MSGSDKPKSNRSKSPPHEPSLQETAPYPEPSTGYGPTPQESPAPHQPYPQEPPRYPAPPAKPLQIPAGRGAHPYAVLTRDIADFAGDGADPMGRHIACLVGLKCLVPGQRRDHSRASFAGDAAYRGFDHSGLPYVIRGYRELAIGHRALQASQRPLRFVPSLTVGAITVGVI